MQSAAALKQDPAVPIAWQRESEADSVALSIGTGARIDGAIYAAMGRERHANGCGSVGVDARGSRSGRGNLFRLGDDERCVRDLELCQARAHSAIARRLPISDGHCREHETELARHRLLVLVPHQMLDVLVVLVTDVFYDLGS